MIRYLDSEANCQTVKVCTMSLGTPCIPAHQRNLSQLRNLHQFSYYLY